MTLLSRLATEGPSRELDAEIERIDALERAAPAIALGRECRSCGASVYNHETRLQGAGAEMRKSVYVAYDAWRAGKHNTTVDGLNSVTDALVAFLRAEAEGHQPATWAALIGLADAIEKERE